MSSKCELAAYTALLLTAAFVIQNDHRIAFLETEWFQQYWTVSLPISVVYGLMVAFGGRLMAGAISPALHKSLLRCWNFLLALFSILGAYRVCGEFLQTIAEDGLQATFCSRSYFERSREIYFWYFLFVVSKVAEMGDTVLLLLGGKPVRFIHWYHHIATMIYSFYIAAYLPAIGRWMAAMNFAVHSLMYSYYWLAAVGWRLPRPVSMTITALQIVQMFAGLGVTVAAYLAENWRSSSSAASISKMETVCQNGGYTVEAAILMYSTYVYLFIRFFVVSYLSKKKSRK